MNRLVLLSKAGCPFCSLLKMELGKRGHAFTEIDLSDDERRHAYYDVAGVNTMPQLYQVEGDAEFVPEAPHGQRLGGWTEVSSNWQRVKVI